MAADRSTNSQGVSTGSDALEAVMPTRHDGAQSVRADAD